MSNETDPLGKATNYAYDANGNVQSKTDANGNIIFYLFDQLRRLTQKTYPDATTETYSYDTAGRMLTAANKNVSYTYSYDTGGRLTNVVDSRGYALAYSYDILGMRTQTALQSGTPDAHVINYGYDNANRPSTITSNAGTFTYGYDSQGRRNSISYPNGTTSTYSFDKLSRLTGVKHAAGVTTIAFANYSAFDNVGNRKNKTTNASTESYSYDAIYRLISTATPKGTETYSYDAVGNRLTGPGPKNVNYQYNAGNQMLTAKIFGHDYDNDGNQITRITTNGPNKGWTYTWDYENRLVKSDQTKGNEKRTVTFAYDPQGRRIQKQLTTIIKGITQISTWVYVYDGDNIAIEIFNDVNGNVLKTWYTHGVGTDEHLALERNGSYNYYYSDGLGSITTITDGSANIVQSYSYDSFGVPRPSTNFLNPYTYTGREWEKETGLYYYRARYYDPMEGRFISKDPLGFSGGDVNLFAYAGNNPLNFTDPNGTSFIGNAYSWLKWGRDAEVVRKIATQIARDKDMAMDALLRGHCQEAQIYEDEANALYKIYLDLLKKLAMNPPPGTTISNPGTGTGR